MKRLAITPMVVLCLVIGLALSAGSEPLKFSNLIAALRTTTATRSTRTVNYLHHSRRKSSAYTVSVVKHPWKPGIPQWGVQAYWPDNPGDLLSTIWTKAQRIVDYIVELDANSICISFPFYTPSIDGSTVSAGAGTPSPARVGILIREARRAYLRVTVRPILDEATLGPPKGWRGIIKPADRDVWFASYQRLLMPYARISQKYGAASLVVGTELDSMEGDHRWDGLIASLGRQFKGEISYDAAWPDYLSRPVNIPVHYLGVDSYFPVDAPDSASIAGLVAGWNRWLDRKSTGKLPRILLSEVGIVAQDDAYAAPGKFDARHRSDPWIQANWYRAACAVARERDMAGLYVWALDFNSNPDKPTPPTAASPFTFAGRPQSELALRACFSTSYKVR
jgi:hypothetical protein